MTLFEELKRRKVFRVAGTYAVVAWILMQIGEVTFPALKIPEWVMSTLVVLLLSGFPIAIIFAWIFDKTPEGLIKTKSEVVNSDDDREWYTKKRTYFTVIGILSGFIIGIYGPQILNDGTNQTKLKDGIQKLAILPFSNIRPNEETDFLGYALSDEIINRLGYLKSLIVRPATVVKKYRGVEISPEEVGQELLHLRDTGGTTDEDDFVDGGLVHLRVAKGLFDRVHALTEQVHAEFFEASTGDGGVEVNALEERVDFDGRLRRGRQGALRAFARRAETTERLGVAGDVLLVLALELLHEVVDHAVVEVLAAEERVAVGRLDLEDAVADLEDRHVEGAAAEVIDGDGLRVLLVEAVGQRRRGRLVDDAQHVETGDLAGVLGGLTLGVVEIGGDRDDGLRHLLAEIGLGGLLHLLQDHRRDLRGRIFLAGRLDPGIAIVGIDDLVGDHALVFLRRRILEGPADQTLDRKQRVFGIGNRLALGRLADEALAVVGGGADPGMAAAEVAAPWGGLAPSAPAPAAVAGGPDMVYVLPEPVWPYAKMHTL